MSSKASSSSTDNRWLVIIVLLILVALAFDFLNGFHDAANLIATVVSTHVLPSRESGSMGGIFNFVATFGFGTAVATPSARALSRAVSFLGFGSKYVFSTRRSRLRMPEPGELPESTLSFANDRSVRRSLTSDPVVSKRAATGRFMAG